MARSQITVTPNPISFGVVGLGLKGVSTLNLKNTGTAAATLQSFTFSPSNVFGLNDGSVPVTLKAGQTLAYSVAFLPAAAQTYMSTILNYIVPFAGITRNQVVAAWVNTVDSLVTPFPQTPKPCSPSSRPSSRNCTRTFRT